MGPLAIMAVSGAISGLAKIGMGMAGRGARRRELREAQGEYDASRARYKDRVIQNPFENVQQNFQNTYEDITVSTKAAEFQNQMFQQSQANLMQGLQRSAGGSGVASLAQALANQNMMQSQASSASIAQQEAANQQLIAKGGMMEQQMELQAQTVYGKGVSEQQRLDLSRQSTLFGMDAQRLGAAKKDIAAHKAMIAGGIGEVAGSVASGYAAGYSPTGGADGKGGFSWDQFKSSDRKLKKNIKLVGKSPSGLNIYNFEYKSKENGKGIYQGVMSDEIPQEAVVRHANGYDMVDYSKLDVQFKSI